MVGIKCPWTLSLSGGMRLGQFLNPASPKFECTSPKSLRRIKFSHMSEAQQGFPGGSAGKESACQCRKPRFSPWVGKIPWTRAWQPTPVFLPAAAIAAKSLQSCPTLCNLMDCSLPGFSVHGILQARTLEWVAISFSNAGK